MGASYEVSRDLGHWLQVKNQHEGNYQVSNQRFGSHDDTKRTQQMQEGTNGFETTQKAKRDDMSNMYGTQNSYRAELN